MRRPVEPVTSLCWFFSCTLLIFIYPLAITLLSVGSAIPVYSIDTETSKTHSAPLKEIVQFPRLTRLEIVCPEIVAALWGGLSGGPARLACASEAGASVSIGVCISCCRFHCNRVMDGEGRARCCVGSGTGRGTVCWSEWTMAVPAPAVWTRWDRRPQISPASNRYFAYWAAGHMSHILCSVNYMCTSLVSICILLGWPSALPMLSSAPAMVLSAPASIEGCQSMKWYGSIRWINNPVQSLELTDFTGFVTWKREKYRLRRQILDCFTYIKPKFSAKKDKYLPRWSLYPKRLFSRWVLSITSSKSKVRVIEIRGKTYSLRYFYGCVWRTCAGKPSCRLAPPPPNRFYKLTSLVYMFYYILPMCCIICSDVIKIGCFQIIVSKTTYISLIQLTRAPPGSPAEHVSSGGGG